MPDLMTHATFARDIMNMIKSKDIQGILIKHKYIFYLGAQGPDVFYFHNIFYKDKTKGYKYFGNILHDFKIEEFFRESFQYLKENYNEMLFSYVIGFICHHALDRNTHPYVYHVTGIYNCNNKNTIKYRGNHVRLERAIDSIFIMNHWNYKKPHKFKIYKDILNYKIDKSIFVPFFNHVIKRVYNLDNAGVVFANSAKNYRFYTKIIYDPFGFKKFIAKWIDKLVNKKGNLVFETLFYYHNINREIDYLNLNHKEWAHPVDEQEKSNVSFLDLYKIALKQCCEEINHANDYLVDNVLKLEIKNLSYSTGKPWDGNNEMKYFNHIF